MKKLIFIFVLSLFTSVCVRAQSNLANDYAMAAAEGNWEKAVKILTIMIDCYNYVPAMRLLAYCYIEGRGVPKYEKEAVKWYRKAAEQGDAEAQYMLGCCYDGGIGVSQSKTEAIKWWRKAAEQGYANAQYVLGLRYKRGIGVSQSKTEAIKWWRKAAEQGHEYARKELTENGMTQNSQHTSSSSASQSRNQAQSSGSSSSTSKTLSNNKNTTTTTSGTKGNMNTPSSTSSNTASTGTVNGHEWVDLGLSVKWATMNVGATSPEDYGDYYAWGETSTKSYYDWSTYFDSANKKGTKFHKYGNYWKTKRIRLELSDDVAYVKWGGNWRMPTEKEFNELREDCIWTWTTQNGVKGYRVSSKWNNNFIFLPAAGGRTKSSLFGVDMYGEYWSSSYQTIRDMYGFFFEAYRLFFEEGKIYINDCYRRSGISVRAVCP